MHTTLLRWLEELSKEFKFADDSDSQADENMHSFSWHPDDRAAIPINEIAEFIQDCSDVVASRIGAETATFYAWVDDMADQLRFSVISGHRSALPFRCKVAASSISDIAKETSTMTSSLYSSEFLKVWVREINHA